MTYLNYLKGVKLPQFDKKIILQGNSYLFLTNFDVKIIAKQQKIVQNKICHKKKLKYVTVSFYNNIVQVTSSLL